MRGGYDNDVAEEDGDEADLDQAVQDFLAAHGAAGGVGDEVGDEGDGEEVPGEPERGWPDEKLDAQLYPESKYTVRQFAYALLREKQLGTMHDDCCERICKLFNKVLPDGNGAPTYVSRPCCASFDIKRSAAAVMSTNSGTGAVLSHLYRDAPRAGRSTTSSKPTVSLRLWNSSGTCAQFRSAAMCGHTASASTMRNTATRSALAATIAAATRTARATRSLPRSALASRSNISFKRRALVCWWCACVCNSCCQLLMR